MQELRTGYARWASISRMPVTISSTVASYEACGQALFFARNFFVANASGYKLTDADLAQIICLRHASTSFACSDAMWVKYGAALSARAGNFLDPKTKQWCRTATWWPPASSP